jgi:hypothetical protein
MSNFSHDGFILHPDLRDKRKPVSMEWVKGPKITKENLKKGTGCIELVAQPDWIKTPLAGLLQQSKRGVTHAIPVGPSQRSMQNPAIMTFGKYKNKLLIEILEEDPRYLQWCVQEIEGFEAKLRKAGINPDEI